jgi:hypothetical protein
VTESVQPPRLNEAALIQNEALGAFALWRFLLGFQNRDGQAATIPLAFLILPLVFHAPTLEIVLRTYKSSGLHLFAGKLGEQREDLIAIHGRALSLRQLSLESLMRAEQSGLIRIDPAKATMWAISPYDDMAAPSFPESIRRIAPACEKLGFWFAGLSDQQVAHTLRVEF